MSANGARQPSAAAAAKAEREQDQAQAMREYQAERAAVAANCARLRALRLAREAAAGEAQPRRPVPVPRRRPS